MPGQSLTRRLAALALVGALSACNQGGVTAKNESAEKVAEKIAAAPQITPQPGRWESTVKIDKFDMGEQMPPQMQAAMQKAMGGEKVFASCLTTEEAKKPKAGFFHGASGCTYDTFTMAAGHIAGVMSCKQGGSTQRVKMQGTYDPASYQMHIDSEAQLPEGHAMSTSMTITSKRVGECTGKEQG